MKYKVNIVRMIDKEFEIEAEDEKKAEEKADEQLNELETYKHYYEELTTGQVKSAQLLKKYVIRDELEKKDKIIDAMALQLSGLVVWDFKKDEPVLLKTEEEVKQYFERKVKDE